MDYLYVAALLIMFLFLGMSAGYLLGEYLANKKAEQRFKSRINSLEWKLVDEQMKAQLWKHYCSHYKSLASKYKKTMVININEIPKGDNIPKYGDEE